MENRKKNTRIFFFILIAVLISGNAVAGNKLIAWGFNSNGQCDVPGGSNYVSVAAGSYHSVALTSNGSIECWGLNAYGQCTAPSGNGYQAIAAKGHWSLAIDSSGRLQAWGRNDYGQCDVPAGNYVAIATGVRHGLAVKSDGTVVAWGDNSYGQCNVPEGNFVNVAAGLYSSFAIGIDGTIEKWGTNIYSLLNVPSAGSVISLSTGMYHTVALEDNGSLEIWGSNVYGQFNLPTGTEYRQASAGVFHTVAIDNDGEVKCAGMDFYGQCQIPQKDYEWVNVASGDFHNVALVKEPVVNIEIEVEPKTLNLSSKGRWITCRIFDANEYDVNGIDQKTLVLNEKVFADRITLEDGDMVIKFKRDQVQNILAEGSCEVIVTGAFNDGNKLAGHDVIRAIDNKRKDKHISMRNVRNEISNRLGKNENRKKK